MPGLREFSFDDKAGKQVLYSSPLKVGYFTYLPTYTYFTYLPTPVVLVG